MHFRRVEKLKELRNKLYEIFRESVVHEIETYGDAAVRRLLRAAIMNTVLVEYLGEWEHESASMYAQTFGKIKFPFIQTRQIDPESPFLKSKSQIIINLLHSFISFRGDSGVGDLQESPHHLQFGVEFLQTHWFSVVDRPFPREWS